MTRLKARKKIQHGPLTILPVSFPLLVLLLCCWDVLAWPVPFIFISGKKSAPWLYCAAWVPGHGRPSLSILSRSSELVLLDLLLVALRAPLFNSSFRWY